MDAISFILKTQELIPNEQILRKKYSSEELIIGYLNGNINFKDPNNIIDTKDPIDFILVNCNYSNFRTNPIDQFIEPINITHVTLFGDTDLGYIGVNNLNQVVFKISYEPIADYLYDDGEIPNFDKVFSNGEGAIPNFDEIIPIAKNIYCFFDALVCWLELQKIIAESDENSKITFFNSEITNSYKEKAIIASGGKEFMFDRLF
jgi:hypothetical protein